MIQFFFVLLLRLLYLECHLQVSWGDFYTMHPVLVNECDIVGRDAFVARRVFINVKEAYADTLVVEALICRCPAATPRWP